ncbi:MAG: mercuric transporter MerT family protein [Gemmatimonadaceae bacterium]
MLPAATKAFASTAGGVVAAIASTICCAGPLVALTLGFSAAGLATAFEPWRPVFVGATVLGLGYGHWMLRHEQNRACVPGASCASPRARRRLRWALWTATALAIPLLLFPWWSRFILN